MTVRRNREQPLSVGSLQALIQLACIVVGGASLMLPAGAKPLAPLGSVCLEITPTITQPALSKTVRPSCCRRTAASKCLSLQQLFPPVEPVHPGIRRPVGELPYIPRLDEAGNNLSSQGAAKDAVIQLGITQALNVITPLASESKLSDTDSARQSFFQRAAKTYQRFLGPKLLKSGAVLTPQVEMNMNLGDVSLDSVKLGVGIKF
jgi:hypothetical protein